MTILGRVRQHHDDAADAAIVDGIAGAFREACMGAQLGVPVDGPVAGSGMLTPNITFIDLRAPVRLTVRMPGGMVPGQLRSVGHLIAPHLGGVDLRVVDRGHGWALVTILTEDPLAEVLPLVLPRAGGSVLFGRTEDGSELAEDFRKGAHTIAQGVTRSGKSVWMYGILAQLAGLSYVTVGGIDPTGLLFRPFANTRHAEWQISGLKDIPAIEKMLERYVDEMDLRISEMPEDSDIIETSAGRPLRVLVLEELAGLYRAVDTQDKDAGKRIRALIGRILAEGAKAGYRVIILVQRAEAAVVDAFARAMCSWRISFRCDNSASVELLHPTADKGTSSLHTSSLPGIALVSMPGRELIRMRAPLINDGYRGYVAAVRSACRVGQT
jgi:hypothetical protein